MFNIVSPFKKAKCFDSDSSVLLISVKAGCFQGHVRLDENGNFVCPPTFSLGRCVRFHGKLGYGTAPETGSDTEFCDVVMTYDFCATDSSTFESQSNMMVLDNCIVVMESGKNERYGRDFLTVGVPKKMMNGLVDRLKSELNCNVCLPSINSFMEDVQDGNYWITMGVVQDKVSKMCGVQMVTLNSEGQMSIEMDKEPNMVCHNTIDWMTNFPGSYVASVVTHVKLLTDVKPGSKSDTSTHWKLSLKCVLLRLFDKVKIEGTVSDIL